MKITRRRFLQAASAAVWAGTQGVPGIISARGVNEKLSVACIGVTRQGNYSVQGVRGEHIAALCDVDEAKLNQTGDGFPDAERFFDWRDLLDSMGDKLDAVTVATPDHCHAPIALAAMDKGIHCYCEKPLAHTIEEVRAMMSKAAEKNLVTQMGTQMHATDNYRRAVEMLQAQTIGEVTDVWLWTPKGQSGLKTPSEFPPCPEMLHWDIWIGPSSYVDYHPDYCPGIWRYWWNFGSGRFGDMACHLTDLVYWGLGLGWPAAVQAAGKPEDAVDPAATPPTFEAEFEFDSPKVRLHWRVGNPPAILAENGMPEWTQGILFVGTEGFYLVDYERNILFPEEKFASFVRPAASIPSSPGHHAEWLAAIRSGNPQEALCGFSYGGRLTQSVYLANISYRCGGKRIEWDPETGRVTNLPEANRFLTKSYRTGWEFL